MEADSLRSCVVGGASLPGTEKSRSRACSEGKMMSSG